MNLLQKMFSEGVAFETVFAGLFFASSTLVAPASTERSVNQQSHPVDFRCGDDPRVVTRGTET